MLTWSVGDFEPGIAPTKDQLIIFFLLRCFYFLLPWFQLSSHSINSSAIWNYLIFKKRIQFYFSKYFLVIHSMIFKMYFTKANSNYWTDILKVRNGNKTMKLRTQSLRSKTSKIKLARKIMDAQYLVLILGTIKSNQSEF